MHPVQKILVKIETELRSLELWQRQPPSEEALASEQPFAIDTMSFDQWLQWILLPRLDWMLQQEHSLPANCQIAPYAEEALKQVEEDTDALLALIQQLDNNLNRVH